MHHQGLRASALTAASGAVCWQQPGHQTACLPCSAASAGCQLAWCLASQVLLPDWDLSPHLLQQYKKTKLIRPPDSSAHSLWLAQQCCLLHVCCQPWGEQHVGAGSVIRLRRPDAVPHAGQS